MKSDYSKESITEFLSRKYGEGIRFFPIKEGQESQACWFSCGGREYVVRINSNMEGFEKDKYAYGRFRPDRVPISEVARTGNLDGMHYFCISAKADGITYEGPDEETVVRLLGDITGVTEAISRTDISGISGCGVFGSDTGDALFHSRREYPAEVFERGWTTINRSYVNLSLIDELLAAYREPISYCPEGRALFHGDFGSNNVIVGKKSRISGAIDWNRAAYRDFLYDITTAYFQRTWLMCMKKTTAYWERKYSHLSRYTERTLCYELRIGLTEIYENAVKNDTETTKWLQNRCRGTLGERRRRKA